MGCSAVLSCALIFLHGIGLADAQNILRSTAFTSCQNNTSFTASKFDASVDRDNNTISYSLVGTNAFSGNATFIISLISPRKTYYTSTLDPCESLALATFCPSVEGPFILSTSQEVPQAFREQWPDSLFTRPDQHAQLRFQLEDVATGKPVACVEASLSNGIGQAPEQTTVSGTPSQTTTSGAPKESTTSSIAGSSSTTASDGPGNTGATENSSVAVLSFSRRLVICATIFWVFQIRPSAQ